VIRFKDGETNFLAGLLRTDETTRRPASRASPNPHASAACSRATSTTRSARTSILTMTPHIIRRSDISEVGPEPIWVGTEQNITFRATARASESEVEGGPFDEGAAAADRVRELIRQRVQELPPGLEEGAEEEGARAAERGAAEGASRRRASTWCRRRSPPRRPPPPPSRGAGGGAAGNAELASSGGDAVAAKAAGAEGESRLPPSLEPRRGGADGRAPPRAEPA
jgi:hypothetical protein